MVVRTIGIDPSLSATGLAIVESYPDFAPTLVHQEVIKTDPKLAESHRLGIIYTRIKYLVAIEKAQHPPTELKIGIEDYTLGTARVNPRTMVDLAQVGGVIRLAIYHAEASHLYEVLGPGAWKVAVFGPGNGAMRKDQLLKEVLLRFGLDFKDHNAAEAFCVAVARHLGATASVKGATKAKRAARKAQITP